MDLSFAAAVKLGIYPAGTGRVRVQALHPGDPEARPTTILAAAPAPRGGRFDIEPTTAAGSADRFDAWMKDREVRIATGRPMAVEPPAVAVKALPPPSRSTAAVVSAASVRPAVPAPAGTTAEAPVVLQVASFSTRDNADRALATLQRAGIAQAQVLGAEVAGQPVWRLRVGPLAAAEEADLIARLGGLGFGSPRRVRD
jgi:rare lipoprotein A